jgi:Flp pilus assembly pilin Flp
MLALFLKDEKGSTAVEYAAIASFLSILVYAGALAIGKGLADRQFGALLAEMAKAKI